LLWWCARERGGVGVLMESQTMTRRIRRRASRRSSGRPDAEASKRLDRLLLATARRMFIERGYAATSIEQVALSAGAGKQTIYRRYPSKRSLFTAVLEDLAGDLPRSAALVGTTPSEPLAVLRKTCRAMLDANTRAETVAIYRVLVAESQRFPRLVEHAFSHITEPVAGLIRHLLAAAQERGQIRHDLDIEQSVRALSGLINGWGFREGIQGRKGLSSEAERNAFFETAWTMFLRGVGK